MSMKYDAESWHWRYEDPDEVQREAEAIAQETFQAGLDFMKSLKKSQAESGQESES